MIVQMATPQLELWRIDGEFVNLPHTHDDEFQITVPIRGACRFTQENKDYDLQIGDGLVQHPRERHSFHIGLQSGVLIFKVRQSRMKELAGGKEPEFSLRQRLDPSSVAGKFRKWTNALLACDPSDRLAKEETETQVLSYLYNALSGNQPRDRGRAPSAAVFGTDPFLGRVLDYIHANYAGEIRIDTLAELAAQSRYHFIRSFKAETGSTPYQYVLRLRMEEAKRRLRNSDESVTDIGFGLGFSSASQFYRVFMKAVGVTPEQFRHFRR
ncbi:helix-turn-helix domain-containing protein [Cohnella massiliensis]|uniref:helix-turn-helix domain-containing protein n=1 Tax=Cohnella massiliensis TaxID=1816691 RepID=UPI0009BAD19E|nr:AraC family transcriptional regulator [Cohnella massiliensis]